jgi:ribonuclease HII
MPNFHFENHYGRRDNKIICGVDEVGRGPLAGPVVAAAVILPFDLAADIAPLINDSKKMSAKQRDVVNGWLLTHARVSVAEASVEEIDRVNILQASMLAMRRAVDGLGTPIDMALVDGNRCPKLTCAATPIVKGDGKSLSIAAASVAAKVVRDHLMKKLAGDHPGYGWERNMGYGTAEHLSALRQLGATPWHRCSFAPVYELNVLTG